MPRTTLSRLRAVARALPLVAVWIGAGCLIALDERPQHGDVNLRWSIEGTFDPALCAVHNASAVQIDVYDSFGRDIVRAFPPCESFQTTITLSIGRRTASMVMVDSSRHAVSTALNLVPFDVVGGFTLPIDTDFPRSSFYLY